MESKQQGSTSTECALFVSAFIDELVRCGARDLVVSPGSRSTPLAMIAYQSKLRVHVDVDERGAAFLALGMAKASGQAVAALCTSGTAVANYYPAVLEAESSRVPLLLLTGDRPPHLQDLGSPQTCDQIKIFGDHVRYFRQMPLPGAENREIAFVRQVALEAYAAAVGSQESVDDEGNPWYSGISTAGPVHLNFPFDEPLTPNLQAENLFVCGRRSAEDTAEAEAFHGIGALRGAALYPDVSTINLVKEYLRTKRTLVLCGEGSFSNHSEALMLRKWAHHFNLPLLADPLSNLRGYDDPLIIDHYDAVFRKDIYPEAELIIRFGRYPVSKACCSALANKRPLQIVVDAAQTRDFNAMTDLFVRCTPAAFLASCMYGEARAEESHTEELSPVEGAEKAFSETQEAFAQEWVGYNEAAAQKIKSVQAVDKTFEGVFVARVMELAPKDSCVFSASSMAIRLIDTFYCKKDKPLTLLCNRGLNGIDGTLSSAVGAAHSFSQTTLLMGDLAFLHDLSALALQRELLINYPGEAIPNIIVVVMNNRGGGIFETLPQQSQEAYFRRLFLTPQDFSLADIACAFDMPFVQVSTVAKMEEAYQGFLGKPGIHLIEIPCDSTELKNRYGNFFS